MNFKKHISYKTTRQIWRILISGSDKVLIEKRDTDKKEVYFDCFDLETNNKIFSDFQFDEKFWIGIERIYNDVLFLHKFPKPDMPGHKEITAFDIPARKILWNEEEYSYLFVYAGKVYVFKQMFEGRKYYALDYKTGELLEELDGDTEKINELYYKSREAEDYADYSFPNKEADAEEGTRKIIEELKRKIDILNEVEYNIINNTLLISYHTGKMLDSMTQKFMAVNPDNGEEVFTETLCADTDKFMSDSFFIYKNYLFLLLEKNCVKILKINTEV